MNKRKSLKQLKELIGKDLKSCKEFMQSTEGDENPQIKEMYFENEVRAKALQDVIDYIEQGVKYQFSG